MQARAGVPGGAPAGRPRQGGAPALGSGRADGAVAVGGPGLAERLGGGEQPPAVRGEAVLDVLLPVQLAADEALALEGPQRLCEHLGRDAVDAPQDVVVAARAV